MQIFTVNITRVVWPHVKNKLHLRYFCERNPSFYYLNLIPCYYWSWQRSIYFLVNIFARHTFPMSKSSIKTKTVLIMTDMKNSTDLQPFKRQEDGYKVTVKISLCICVVLSWDKLKVRQNFFGNYCIQKTKMSRSINDSFVGWSQSMVTIVNLIDKLHTDLANWSVL